MAGDPIAGRAAAEEGRDLADAIGDRSHSRQCRFYLGTAQMCKGDLAGAVTQLAGVAAEAEAAHDEVCRADSLAYQGVALAWQGDTGAARPPPTPPSSPRRSCGILAGIAYRALAAAALADGDARDGAARARRPAST